ncbi:MAG TPA: amino acid adenylation domain-containing protein, partial [Longimicrobium sp.]|nr:amino acid adenylation domain-containing protein [Longimicrobium sp.]
MYTSGSTGRPKGVEVPHRAVVRLVRETDFIDVRPDDVFLQMAPASFDAATLELWGPLLNGAHLALYPPEAPTVDGIARVVAERGVTILWLTAGLFHLVVDEDLQALRGIRILLAGGDVLSPAHVRRVLARLPGTTLINGYGPTENTTFTCCHRVESLRDDAASVPIGRPITNTRVYILDGRMQPVPIGVPGELYAGGAGVALGYLDRPDATADAFVASPFIPGDRLYRTGDRARWLPDGTVEFLGRADAQVKLRGFRVEPGEVEAALRAHPAVREAAVAVHEDAPGDRRLIAYTVGDVDAATLLAFARERLPEYLVPAAVVVMDALPLTPSGKVDRRALPAPERTGAAGGYTPPRSETEALLAAVWTEVLGVDRVGVTDSFFALGGNSLRAMRAAARVRDALGMEVPLRLFFEAPTVAAQAERLAGEEDSPGALENSARLARADRGDDETFPRSIDGGAIVPRADDEPAPLSFAQERLWLVEQLQPGSAAYTVSTGLRVRGALDAEALGRALNEVVRRHEPLRTRLVEAGGGAAQVVDPASPVPLATLDLSTLPAAAREEALRAHASAEAARPFRLADEAPLRASLVRLAPGDHALLFFIHHTAVDGWSLSLLFRELDALYGAFARGAQSPLLPLPVRYGDYAAWQREALRGPALERQLDWWRARLAGMPEVPALPTDRSRPAAPSHRGGTHRLALSRELADALRALAAGEGATLFMALLAGFQALLHRYSGDDDFGVGTPVAGRARPETEGLIGLFVNTLVLRADLSGDPDFRALLRRVRDAALGAWANQDAPFERVVDALGAGSGRGHNPLFQVMFALQNAGDLRPRLDGLAVERVGVHAGGALFDLTWSLVETDDGIEGVVEYSADLFDATTAERMADHFRALLAAAVADPGARVSALPLLAGAERDTVLGAWSGGDTPAPRDTVHRLFAARAAEAPDAVAL